MSKEQRKDYLKNHDGVRASELPNPTSQKGLEYSAREADHVLDERAPNLSEKLAGQVATFRESARALDSGREASNGSREEAVSGIVEWAKSQGRLIDPDDFRA